MNYYNYPTPITPQPGQYIVQPSESSNNYNPFYQRPRLLNENPIHYNQHFAIISNESIYSNHNNNQNYKPIVYVNKFQTKRKSCCFPCCIL